MSSKTGKVTPLKQGDDYVLKVGKDFKKLDLVAEEKWNHYRVTVIPDGAKTVTYMHSGMQNAYRRGKSQGHLFRSHGNSPSARH